MRVDRDAVLVVFLKVRRDGAMVTSAGRSFHMRAVRRQTARCFR